MSLDKYKSTDQTIYDEVGPCIAPGHPKEHKLEVDCLTAMRKFVYPDKSFKDFIDAVKRK